MEKLREIVGHTWSDNIQTQKHAELELTRLSKLDGFSSALFKIIVDANTPISTQQGATIFLKNYISSSKEDFGFIKNNLLEAITRASSGSRKQLGVVLHNFANTDYPGNWKDLLPSICEQLKSNDMVKIYGALFALRHLIKAFSYGADEVTKPQNLFIIQHAFPILIQLSKYLLTQNSVEFAEMRKLVVKIFWSAAQHVPNLHGHFGEASNFDSWFGILISIVTLEVPKEANDTSQFWKARKWVVHLLYRLMIVFNTPELSSNEMSKKVSKYFLETYGLKLFMLFTNIVETKAKGEYVPERIVTLSIYYLTASIVHKSLFKIAFDKLDYFFHRIIFPFMCFGEADAKLWKSDPEEYVRASFNTDDMYSSKLAASNLLLDLSLKEECVGPLLGFINKIFKTNEQPNVKEGALHCIGIMKKAVMKSLGDKCEILLQTYCIPELKNAKYPFLRSRACWVIGKFIKINWSLDGFKQAIQQVLNNFGEKELPVRIEAALCLAVMIRRNLCNDELKSVLPKIFTTYLDIMKIIDNDWVVYALDIVIKTYGDTVEPYAVNLVENLCKKTISLIEETEEDPDTNGGVIMESLTCICTILEQMRERKQFFNAIENRICPLLAKILEHQSLDYLETGMEIFCLMTWCSKDVTSNYWVIYNMMMKAYDEWACDFVECFIAPLDNLISRDPDTFVKEANVGKAYNFCKKIIHNKHEQDDKNYHVAAKLFSIIFQWCRGKFDPYFNHFLTLLLERLTKDPPLLEQILWFDALSDAISYNSLAVLTMLEQQNCTMSLFGLWFKVLPFVKRVIDLKIQCIGLTNLLNSSKLPGVVEKNLALIVKKIIWILNRTAERKKEIEDAKKEWDAQQKDYLERKDRGEVDSEYSEDDEEFDGMNMTEVLQQMSDLRNQEALPDDYDHDDGNYGQADDEEDELEEEDETYTNGWDNVDEVKYFIETMKKQKTRVDPIYNQLIDSEKKFIANLK